MQILVTGAHGFLGRHVAKMYAAAGASVSGIGHGNWTHEELRRYGIAYWHTADITLDNLVTYGREPDIIVHCAGSGSVPFSVAHPYQDFSRTVDTTAIVLEYIRVYWPKAILVYPSSAAVYGVVESLPINEYAVLKPSSPYGMHKLMAEEICRSYAAQYGLAVVIVRLFSIYGEGLKKQLLWDACSKVTNGKFTFFGTGKELRDWLHVEDASRLLQIVTEIASPNCPAINGGSGIGVSVYDVLSVLIENLGYSQKPNFSGSRRIGDPPGMQADISSVFSLDWHPTISWQEGLSRYASWFKNECQ